MTHAQGVFSLATAGLLLAVVTACGSSSKADPTPTPSPSVTETVDSPSPSATSPEESASATAIKVVANYYAVTDHLLQDSSLDLKQLESVAISAQLSALQKFLSTQRDGGFRQTGDTQVVETKVQSVSLDNSDPKTGRVPSVSIDVCLDVSATDFLNASGKSVVPAERPERTWTRLNIANYSWDKDPAGGWRVASGQDLEKSPCEG